MPTNTAMNVSPLKRLPPELRLLVYEYMLSTNEQIGITSTYQLGEHYRDAPCRYGKHERGPHNHPDCPYNVFLQRPFQVVDKLVLLNVKQSLAISQTCRKIRRESTLLVFSCSRFDLDLNIH